MAVLTSLTLDEASSLGAQYGLSIASVQGLLQGSVNSNYALHLKGGGRVFLRIYEEQSTQTARLEAAMLHHLASHGVCTPNPLYRKDTPDQTLSEHAGKPVIVFPWAEGESICHARTGERHVFELGKQLARIHTAGASFEGAPPNRFSRIALIQRLSAIDPESAGASLRDEILSAASMLTARLESVPEPPKEAILGVIHGDLFRDNVLWQGERVSALLDFESASRGTAPFDLSVTLWTWCYGVEPREDLFRAMSAGYVSERPLSPLEREILFEEAKLSIMRFAATRITDFELRPHLGFYRDFRRYLKRLGELETLGPRGYSKLLGLC